MAEQPRILVAAAMEMELAPLRRRLADVPVPFVCTGMGGERAAATIRAAVEAYRPKLVVLVGFAGGLDPVLTMGDVIRVGCVRDEHGGGIEFASPAMQGHCGGLARMTLLSVDRVVSSAQEKARLFKAHLAVAVDMETWAVAQALRPVNVELVVLRAITDPAATAPPTASRHWVTQDGRPRILPAARWALTHPWRLGDLARLRRAARFASVRLASEAEPIIRERLP